MRRSLEPRVRTEGEVLFEAGGGERLRAELVNVSRGGVCARGVLPLGWGPGGETAPLGMTLSLSDGAAPLSTRARVAWVRDEDRSFGLCFVDLGGDQRERIAAVVSGEQATRRPAAPRTLRLRLDGGPVLRAEAESLDERGAIVGAELPWLRLGGLATTELDGREQCGHIDWVGMDVSPSGAARLRLRVAFDPALRERRDTTLPYFSTEARAPVEGTDEEAAPPRDDAPPKSAMFRVSALVRLGERRRVRMGLLRVAIGMLALSALLLFVRALREPQPPEPTPTAVEAPATPNQREDEATNLQPSPTVDEPAAAPVPTIEALPTIEAVPTVEALPAIEAVPMIKAAPVERPAVVPVSKPKQRAKPRPKHQRSAAARAGAQDG